MPVETRATATRGARDGMDTRTAVPDNDGLRMVASGQGLWDNQEDQHDSLQPLLQQQHAAAGATCNGDSCASPMNAITSSILNLVGLAPQATPNAQQTRSMSTGLQTPAAQAMARGVARPATSYADLNDVTSSC
jgi:cobalamin biosynthesis Mg chelatase CobN